jgi:hypothetical protein
MLAGIEKALPSGAQQNAEEMTAIETLTGGLFDYAGLFPPASLDMRAATGNFLRDTDDRHSAALGRFVVDESRIAEFREFAGSSVREIPLSLLITPATDWGGLARLRGEGIRIESIEVKTNQPAEIKSVNQRIGQDLTAYFEIPICEADPACLDAIAAAGARVKLRMGSVVPTAIPSTAAVATMLKILADRRLPFKATAGLHHSIRAEHALTYRPNSPVGLMHGFVNLLCASALVYFGGDIEEAKAILDEQDPGTWRMTAQAVCWCARCWSVEQLRDVRQHFMTSIGSCSFREPIEDLETMGWL